MTDRAAGASPPSAAPPEGGSKRELREWARAVRARVRAESGGAVDEAVCAAIRASELYKNAETVALYLPMGDEVDVLALLRDPKRFLAPRMRALPTPWLTFHELGSDPAGQLELHEWGVRQPHGDAPRVELHEIDLLLVPGLLFDLRGVRIGYGKGYYDRLLAPQLAAATGESLALPTTVGVTYEALVVRELPADAHDVAVDQLASEAGMRPVTPSPPSAPPLR